MIPFTLGALDCWGNGELTRTWRQKKKKLCGVTVAFHNLKRNQHPPSWKVGTRRVNALLSLASSLQPLWFFLLAKFNLKLKKRSYWGGCTFWGKDRVESEYGRETRKIPTQSGKKKRLVGIRFKKKKRNCKNMEHTSTQLCQVSE